MTEDKGLENWLKRIKLLPDEQLERESNNMIATSKIYGPLPLVIGKLSKNV